MHPLDMDRLLHQQPFRPFLLVLSSNRLVEVRHPELAEVSLSTVTVLVHPPNEEIVIILSHIVTIEYLPRT